MSQVVTSRRKIILAHVCSKCGTPVVRPYVLYADGRANAFFHEAELAEDGVKLAVAQALKDIALCKQTPRQLGSMTEVTTNNKRQWAFYQIENLAVPCKCGHVESWQRGKKSFWNPVDVPFARRPLLKDVPEQSRPVLLDNDQAVDSWIAGLGGK